MEAGIEGEIHEMRLLWQQHSQEEDWGFLLIDAWNAFNEENRTAILWYLWHEWISGAQFTFNLYRHWATLVVRDTEEGSGHFLCSKEGVTQGDPLSMIVYGIGILPLIRELQDAHPQVTQPWYADDARAGGGGGGLGISWTTSRTCRQGSHQGATSQSRPIVSWSWPQGMFRG